MSVKPPNVVSVDTLLDVTTSANGVLCEVAKVSVRDTSGRVVADDSSDENVSSV